MLHNPQPLVGFRGPALGRWDLWAIGWIWKWSKSCSVMSDSLQSHGLYSPWNFPSQNTGVSSLSPFSKGSSQPRDWTQVSLMAGGFFTSRATGEALDGFSVLLTDADSGVRLLELACCCFLVTTLCPTVCDPMHCSTPGSFVLHHLPEFVQIHVHWFDDTI